MMDKIDPQTKRGINISVKCNDRDLDALKEFKRLIGEEKDSTAFKKAVFIAKSYLGVISGDFDITLQYKKKGFSREQIDE